MILNAQGILQTTIEDLRRQLEQKEGISHIYSAYMYDGTCKNIISEILLLLKEEVAQLRGENEALKREVEILRAEVLECVCHVYKHTYVYTSLSE